MTSRRAPILLTAVAAALVGCGEAPPPPPREFPETDVLQHAPVFQPARLHDIRGSTETYESVFRTDVSPDSVARWYRTSIFERGWEILGDVTASDGTITLHVAREGPPLWVIIRPRSDVPGSEFSVIGAAPDTTTTPQP